jgi:hypothetical protein
VFKDKKYAEWLGIQIQQNGHIPDAKEVQQLFTELFYPDVYQWQPNGNKISYGGKQYGYKVENGYIVLDDGRKVPVNAVPLATRVEMAISSLSNAPPDEVLKNWHKLMKELDVPDVYEHIGMSIKDYQKIDLKDYVMYNVIQPTVQKVNGQEVAGLKIGNTFIPWDKLDGKTYKDLPDQIKDMAPFSVWVKYDPKRVADLIESNSSGITAAELGLWGTTVSPVSFKTDNGTVTFYFAKDLPANGAPKLSPVEQARANQLLQAALLSGFQANYIIAAQGPNGSWELARAQLVYDPKTGKPEFKILDPLDQTWLKNAKNFKVIATSATVGGQTVQLNDVIWSGNNLNDFNPLNDNLAAALYANSNLYSGAQYLPEDAFKQLTTTGGKIDATVYIIGKNGVVEAIPGEVDVGTGGGGRLFLSKPIYEPVLDGGYQVVIKANGVTVGDKTYKVNTTLWQGSTLQLALGDVYGTYGMPLSGVDPAGVHSTYINQIGGSMLNLNALTGANGKGLASNLTSTEGQQVQNAIDTKFIASGGSGPPGETNTIANTSETLEGAASSETSGSGLLGGTNTQTTSSSTLIIEGNTALPTGQLASAALAIPINPPPSALSSPQAFADWFRSTTEKISKETGLPQDEVAKMILGNLTSQSPLSTAPGNLTTNPSETLEGATSSLRRRRGRKAKQTA